MVRFPGDSITTIAFRLPTKVMLSLFLSFRHAIVIPSEGAAAISARGSLVKDGSSKNRKKSFTPVSLDDSSATRDKHVTKAFSVLLNTFTRSQA